MDASKIIYAKPLTTDVLRDIVVNIIIPFKENYGAVQNILESIELIRNFRFVVTLVDDNSQNGHFLDTIKKLPGVNTHRFEEDMGFGYCVNHAIKNSEHNICVIMHSDVYDFEANAIRNLVTALIDGKKENICMVSSTTDMVMPKECSFISRSKGADEPYILIGENEFLPFHCCALSKLAFGKIGGFPVYKYCWFEDKLFAMKAHAFGYKMAYAPRSFVRHRGGETIKQLIKSNSKIVEFLKINRSKFDEESKIILDYLKKNKQ
jgi:GT2 family glycosyltransferase